MRRKVSIPEARELSKSREFTILWRPNGNELTRPDEHFAIAEQHSVATQ